jgi:chromosome partitioning protein
VILAVVQTKGGVGKTTLSANIAVERSRQGRNVMLVDADEQATATGFTSQRAEALGDPGFTCVKLHGADVRTQVLRMTGNYDDVVIDVGGRNTDSLRAALTIADVALVPFQPRSFDIWTLETIGELVVTGRIYNPDLQALAVINFADPTGANNDQAAEALSGVEAIKYLNCPIGRRIAFPNASSDGLAVTELKRQDAKASAELLALINAIFPKE